METQLEIFSTDNENPESHSPTIKSTFQGLIEKLRELTIKQSHRHVEDDWNIPFEKIKFQNFQSSGSQGAVFYGTLSNTPVAVKRVEDVSLTKIRHLRELNHKNIIKFYGVSENSKYYFIIMEYCKFGTLHDHIHKGRPLSSTILSNFVQQIASGMKYLHSKKIIHRDLKPSNILLTWNDVLKISDFGTHKICNEKLLTSKTYAGTQAYMAPEIIRSEPYSYSVDIWSYGVVLWEILTCAKPYEYSYCSAVAWAVGEKSSGLPIPFSFPEGFSRILAGCWKTEPKERLTFEQIYIVLKLAKHEVDAIPLERWLSLQAEWKRGIKKEMDRHLQPKDDCPLKLRALEEALEQAYEQAEERLKKLNHAYLQSQELMMLLARKESELAAREESVTRREQALAKKSSSK